MPQVRYLLLAAAAHVALTTTIFLIGNFQLLPNTIDQNGIGLTFAIDGTTYQRVAGGLADELQTNGVKAWLQTRAPFHSRLYSLAFATFGKVLGHNILAAEPLNLLYYLGILCCIYLLGREVFSSQTGLLAAAIVGLWPTFLVYSAQLMRDSFAILCFLATMLVLIMLLRREFAWRQSIGVGIAGALFVTLFWVIRGNMWNAVLVAVALTLAMLVYRMIREKKFMTGNAVVMLLILVATLLVPTRLESTPLPGIRPPATALAIPSASQPAPPEGIWNRVIQQIANRRAGSRLATARSSDIDSHVRFSGAGDIVRFLPRAAVIGFFAPFPKMWIQAGSSGLAGRLLSGVETLIMYLLYVAVGFCVWRERRNLKVWLLFLVSAIGMLALGLVVVNAGALFRIRYVFWMLLIVLAAEEIRHFTVLRTNLTKS
jgi:4-amino-4-deoxy-L-arabinose transferase-like glycosyltransferase